jgi:hypothetical protein
MTFNKIYEIAVGADLSCAPPIYRPSVPFHTISPIMFNIIIGFIVC